MQTWIADIAHAHCGDATGDAPETRPVAGGEQRRADERECDATAAAECHWTDAGHGPAIAAAAHAATASHLRRA